MAKKGIAEKPPRADKPKKGAAEPEAVTIAYDLADLPTAQHKAGLAGLLLQIESMRARQLAAPDYEPDKQRPVTCVHVTFTKVTTQALFDDAYSASVNLEWYSTKKPKEELRGERTREVRGDKLKEFAYDTTRPLYPAVAQLLGDGGSGSAWLKVWQAMTWGVPRGVNTTRIPFEVVAGWDRKRPKANRRVGRRLCPEGSAAWQSLLACHAASTPDLRPMAQLDGKLWLGAQKESAEQIRFQGRADQNLVLHFWPNAVLISVPQTLKPVRKAGKVEAKRRYDGFAVAIPEVADIRAFCSRYRLVVSALGSEPAKETRWPLSAIIELPAQGGLALAARDQAAGLAIEGTSQSEVEYSISGVDYVHFRPSKNGPRMLSAGRLTLRPGLTRAYAAIVGPVGGRPVYSDPLFRRGLLLALVRRQPWHRPFGQLFTEWPSEFFISTSGSPKLSRFWSDARRKFHLIEANMPDKPDLDDALGVIVLRIVRRYLDERVLADTGNDPREFMKDKKLQTDKMIDGRKKFAQDMFLQFRSRRQDDFASLFRDKLLACGHRLKDEETLKLHAALVGDAEAVKTLTMLALSANSYVPAKKKEAAP